MSPHLNLAWPAVVGAALILSGCGDRVLDRRAVLANEHAFSGAFVTGDAYRVNQLVAGDFIGVDSHGRRYDKLALLTEVRGGPNQTSAQLGEVKLRFFGDTAVAQGDEHDVGPAPARVGDDRVWTDVWVKGMGGWRLVATEELDPHAR